MLRCCISIKGLEDSHARHQWYADARGPLGACSSGTDCAELALDDGALTVEPTGYRIVLKVEQARRIMLQEFSRIVGDKAEASALPSLEIRIGRRSVTDARHDPLGSRKHDDARNLLERLPRSLLSWPGPSQRQR